jgi:hypothetical protein
MHPYFTEHIIYLFIGACHTDSALAFALTRDPSSNTSRRGVLILKPRGTSSSSYARARATVFLLAPLLPHHRRPGRRLPRRRAVHPPTATAYSLALPNPMGILAPAAGHQPDRRPTRPADGATAPPRLRRRPHATTAGPPTSPPPPLHVR